MKSLSSLKSPRSAAAAHVHLRNRGLRLSLGLLAQFALDMVLLSAVFILACHIRFGFVLSASTVQAMLLQLPFVVLWQWLCLLFFHTYRRMWRFTSPIDLPPFVAAFLVGSADMARVIHHCRRAGIRSRIVSALSALVPEGTLSSAALLA